MHFPFHLYFKRGYLCFFRLCESPPCTESWKMFSASSLVQRLSVSSSEDRGEKKSFHPVHLPWPASPHPSPSGLEQGPCMGRRLQAHLGKSSDIGSPSFLFSLLYYSTLNFKLNGNADGHMSISVSQNTHFFMRASLLKCVDRASILSPHYHSVLMSNWQKPVSKTRQ